VQEGFVRCWQGNGKYFESLDELNGKLTNYVNWFNNKKRESVLLY